MPGDVENAANFFDLGARHGLMIGNDRQRLEGGLRKLALLLLLTLEEIGQVVGGPELPSAGDAHERHAAILVFGLQRQEQRNDIVVFIEAAGERLGVERLGGCKQHRFEPPQFLTLSAFRQMFDDILRSLRAAGISSSRAASACSLAAVSFFSRVLSDTSVSLGGTMAFSSPPYSGLCGPASRSFPIRRCFTFAHINRSKWLVLTKLD